MAAAAVPKFAALLRRFDNIEFDPARVPPAQLQALKGSLRVIGYKPDQIERITLHLLKNLISQLLRVDAREMLGKVKKEPLSFDARQERQRIVRVALPDDLERAAPDRFQQLSLLICKFSQDYLFRYVQDVLLERVVKQKKFLDLANRISLIEYHPARTNPVKVAVFGIELLEEGYNPQQVRDISDVLLRNMNELVNTFVIHGAALALAGYPNNDHLLPKLARMVHDQMSQLIRDSLPEYVRSSTDEVAKISKKMESFAVDYVSQELTLGWGRA